MPRTKQIKTGEIPKKLPPREKALREDLAVRKFDLEAKGWKFTQNAARDWSAEFEANGQPFALENFIKLEDLLDHIEGMAEIEKKYAPKKSDDHGFLSLICQERKAKLEAKDWSFLKLCDEWEASKYFKTERTVFKSNNFSELLSAVEAEQSDRELYTYGKGESKPVEPTEDVSPADTVQIIAISNIVPSAFEPQAIRRKKFKDEDLEELGNSIALQGLISPIVVRPVEIETPQSKDKSPFYYEIVVGERRWLASKKKELASIKCFVQNLSDEVALEIQMQENLQRIDIDPLDEAFSYKYYLEHTKHTIHDLSVKFGKPEKFIRQRLKLNELIPEALEDIAAGHLPLGHAALLAKYPAELQKEILEDHLYDWDKEPVSFAEFKDAVDSEVLLKLESVIFDKDATDLHPEGLACTACPERTGYEPMLFADELKEGDSCLNKKCFEAKEKAFWQLQRESAALELPNPKNLPIAELAKQVPAVTDSWHYGETPFGEKKFLERQKLLDEKECDHSIPGVVFKGEKAGQKAYVCRNEKCEVHAGASSSSNSSSGEPAEWELKTNERRIWSQTARGLQRDVVREAAGGFTNFASFFADAEMVRALVLNYLTNVSSYNCDLIRETLTDIRPFPKTFYHDKKIENLKWLESLSEADVTRILFVISLTDNLKSYSYGEVNLDFVRELAKRTEIDFDLLEADKIVEAVSAATAPKEFREKALDYRLALINGEKTKKPYFWYDFEAENKAEEDEDDE